MRSFGILHKEIGRYPLKCVNMYGKTNITNTTLSTKTSFYKALIAIKNTLLRRNEHCTADATLKWSSDGRDYFMRVWLPDGFYAQDKDAQRTTLASMPAVGYRLGGCIRDVSYYYVRKGPHC